MARYTQTAESQLAQLAGVPSGTTFNGYFAALVAGATANYKLRRIILGIRDGASVPISQQMSVAVYRQTVRPTGTGFSTFTGLQMDTRSTPSAITGLDVTTAATAGTSGPTIAASPTRKYTLNTQSGFDIPFEMLEEFFCDQGTANALAFVNIGNPLPAAHLFTLEVEWEE